MNLQEIRVEVVHFGTVRVTDRRALIEATDADTADAWLSALLVWHMSLAEYDALVELDADPGVLAEATVRVEQARSTALVLESSLSTQRWTTRFVACGVVQNDQAAAQSYLPDKQSA